MHVKMGLVALVACVSHPSARALALREYSMSDNSAAQGGVSMGGGGQGSEFWCVRKIHPFNGLWF